MVINVNSIVLQEEHRYQLKRALRAKLAIGLRYSDSTQSYFEQNPMALKRACQITKQHVSYTLGVNPSYVTVRKVQSLGVLVIAVLVNDGSWNEPKLYDVTVDLMRTKVVKLVEIV
jgi:hypothetical protein